MMRFSAPSLGYSTFALINVLLMVVILSIVGAIYLGLSERQDRIVGPLDKISARTEVQIVTVFKQNPTILGGWVMRRNFEKTEVPTLYYWSRHPIIDEYIKTYAEFQKAGKGYSSEELSKDQRRLFHNSEEAVMGLIRCIPITDSVVIEYTTALVNYVKTMCIATLPPFQVQKNINLAIVVASTAEKGSKELDGVKQMLLKLQIDIFNRDYNGKDTWISVEERKHCRSPLCDLY